MANISKIAGPLEMPTRMGHAQPGRTQRDDAGVSADSTKVEILQPQGVNDALKRQEDSGLPEQAIPTKVISDLVSQLQKSLDQASRHEFQVGFHEDSQTGTMVIEIKDRDGEMVKQFPPEKVLNLQRKMDELSGMVIDEMT